ncbi:hypothetical protein ACJX0J_010275, partial [Zea mays]
AFLWQGFLLRFNLPDDFICIWAVNKRPKILLILMHFSCGADVNTTEFPFLSIAHICDHLMLLCLVMQGNQVASLFVMIVLFFHIFIADWWDQYGGDYPELQDGCERNWSTFALLHKLKKILEMISYQIVFTFELIMHYFVLANNCFKNGLYMLEKCFKYFILLINLFTRIRRMHGLIQWQDFEHFQHNIAAIFGL